MFSTLKFIFNFKKLRASELSKNMAHNSKIGNFDDRDITENPEKLLSNDVDLDEDQISTETKFSKTKNQIPKNFQIKIEIRTEPCTNINNMNGDCLSELFRGQFTLQEMMHLRRVCVQWKAIIEQLFAGKRFLKIFITKNSLIDYFRDLNRMITHSKIEKDDEEGMFTLQSDANGVDDVLVVKNLSKNSRLLNLAFVSKLFPNIQHLFIVFPTNCLPHNCSSDQFHNHSHFELGEMLAQWPKLASLSLKDVSSFDKGYSHWFGRDFDKNSFWKTLPQLSSLHLFGLCNIERFPVQVVLGRLKRLTMALTGRLIVRHVRHGKRVELLPYLDKCTRLISVGSNNLLCDECLAGGKNVKEYNTQLTHLTFFDHEKMFTDFSRFKALTYLEVELVGQFQEFAKNLEKLTNLTELRIKADEVIRITDEQQFTNLTIRPDQPIVELSSVVILHLQICHLYFDFKENPTDRELEPTFLKALPLIFPNLKAAKLFAITQMAKAELEMCFKSRGPSHFPLLRSVEFLDSGSGQIDLANYDGPYRELVKIL